MFNSATHRRLSLTSIRRVTALREVAKRSTRTPAQGGFSLIEMLVVVAVITVIMASVLRSIDLTQKTSSSEQVKLDATQQAREFVDQITTDLRSAGYPNMRNVSTQQADTVAGTCPDLTTTSAKSPCSPHNGPGIIVMDYNKLYLAGAVDGLGNGDGTAQVKIIKYDYFATGTNCPCLRRTEYLRTAYQDPVTDANTPTATPPMEIQGVQNGTSTADAIFTPYDPLSGNPITSQITLNSGQALADVNSLRIVLGVKSPYKDYTGAYPITRVVSTVALNNCSEAAGATQTYLGC